FILGGITGGLVAPFFYGNGYGDGYLVNQEAVTSDFLKNFMEVPSRTIENVHALVPQYLKESDAYKA
ncbi:MAG: hypothetical protein EGQ83_04915, partial [Holdemanella biformis]|nr:hypothetical protein [Holdemanella biformis]